MKKTPSLEQDSIIRALMRCLVPAAILLPFLLAFLQIYFFHLGFYPTKSAILFFAFMTSILFLTAAIFTAIIIQEIERKIRKNAMLSRLLVENRKDYCIFLLDPEGKIMSWNAGAERLTGYPSDEMIGKDFSALYSLEDQQQNKPQQLLEHVRLQKQAEYEGWRLHKNGQPFWATITISALFDDQNNLIGFTKLMRNTTRQKEADEKLKQLVVSLERSNKELERFAYIASHDLQEPLRMVASFTQLLAKKYQNQLDKEAQEYIEFAVDGALRMQQLITDLLAYSRVTTKVKVFKPTNCNAIVEQALINLSVSIQESHAIITHDELPTIVADDTQMLQLFQNLISNAIKFHDISPPKIHISVKQLSKAWLFCVKDEGIGIAAESHEQVFLIFQRLHSKHEYSGTGVGLAICKKIVERHGGEIWVESEAGKGATFCFTIQT